MCVQVCPLLRVPLWANLVVHAPLGQWPWLKTEGPHPETWEVLEQLSVGVSCGESEKGVSILGEGRKVMKGTRVPA